MTRFSVTQRRRPPREDRRRRESVGRVDYGVVAVSDTPEYEV